MKRYFLLFLILPMLVFSQRKYDVIDSIHSKRICIDYPGLAEIPSIIEEFQKSKYVFTGKVIEIIRKESIKKIDFQPVQNYWYVIEVTEQFKGKPQKKIEVYSRMFSGVSPFLMIGKEYLIYARYMRKQTQKFFKKPQYLFFYCDAISKHVKDASEDIKLLRKLKK
ncbi:hypothetical protein [uncultured Kordia sp.]|uniref:hypothetical protein n=1 Tax=uncultured Kordia sp. TaxID=507699 RepID=UPI0026193C35|nr:hypothetical protein [uncultured Kordia sp.]